MRRLRTSQQWPWALIAAVAVIGLFFLSRWLFEGAYFRKDIVFVYAPLENLYRLLQRSGASLLWAPEYAGGYPLLATGQLSFFYPVHFVLRHFLPAAWVLNLSLLFHALVGGVGMFWWLRSNRLHEVAAGVGAVLFPLGAVMVGKYESMNLVLPFMWVPIVLLCLQRFMTAGKGAFFWGWIGTTVLAILAGHLQTAVYVVLLAGVFVGVFTVLDWRRWRRALVTLGGVVLIAGLTAFHWLPVLDVVPDTDRANGTLKPNEAGMFDNQFSPAAFWGLILPHPFGHHETYHGPPAENELSNYYGVVALAAALIGLVATRRLFSLWWAAVVFALLGLTLATGGYSPVFTWLVDHGWTYFNFPSRFFFYTHVGLVLLMAAGVHVVMMHVRQRAIRGILLLTMLGPALWVSWGWHDGVPWEFIREPAVVATLRHELGTVRVLPGVRLPGVALDDFFGMRTWNPLCRTCRYRQSFVASFASMDGIALKVRTRSASDGTVTLRLYTSAGQLVREATLSHRQFVDAARDLADVNWSVFRFAPLKNVAGQAFYFELTSTLDADQAPRVWIHTNPGEQYDPTGHLASCTAGDCRPVRDSDLAFKVVVDSPAPVYYGALAPNGPVGFGLGSTQWNGALPILKVKEFMRPFETWGDAFGAGARTMMNRFGTTHLIGVFPPHRYLVMDGFTPLADVPAGEVFLRLYRNDQAWPRLHFAERVRAMTSGVDHINTLFKTDPNERQVVFADIPHDREFAAGQARFIKDERTDIQIRTEQAGEGFLVLRDVVLNGWEATVDNQPVTIYRVDGVFRGVLVPAGEHTVRFVYKPRWITSVVYSESISLAVLLVWGGYYFMRHRQRRRGRQVAA